MNISNKPRSRRLRKKLRTDEFHSRPYPIEGAIAKRVLDFTCSDGRILPALVCIWLPLEVNAHHWRCPWLIQTNDFEKADCCTGDDSMQALLLATHVISSHLTALEGKFDGRFSQYGQDHGFPALNQNTFGTS
ncbi:DUF6968 family protein [Undibacterium sp. Di26W]|uniref:DUF6968 family protein n=1 Tax=Undibacterium sp. Di26W TaxID=3413035 RepID=UPI003BF14E78